MFTAINTNLNRKMDIECAIDSAPNDEYICPICHNQVIIKNGDIMVHHFAHKTVGDCDSFSQDMSDWHKEWQECFPEANREFVLTQLFYEEFIKKSARTWNFNIPYGSKSPTSSPFKPQIALTHRADVCGNGYVIEFQHSPISNTEFNERTWFYRYCGYKVVWVFDFQDEYYDDKIEILRNTDYSTTWKWRHPHKTFVDFVPPSASDINKHNVFLFFQLDEDLLCRVMWVKPKHVRDEFDDYLYTESDFSRFVTYDRYDFTPDEFCNAIFTNTLK